MFYLIKDEHISGEAWVLVSYINGSFGRAGTLCPFGKAGEKVKEPENKIDAIPLDALAVGVACFWPEGVTERLHSPFQDSATREGNIERLSVHGWAKKCARGSENF